MPDPHSQRPARPATPPQPPAHDTAQHVLHPPADDTASRTAVPADTSWKQDRGPLDTSVPCEPRVYDYFLNGADNYRVDRLLAERLLKVAPWLRALAWVNRLHGLATVNYLARGGITQFLDLGCGLPRTHHEGGNTHEAAEQVASGVYTVYVDRDRSAYGHTRVLLEDRRQAVVREDITDVAALFAASAVRAFDYNRPIAVLLHDVLAWIDDVGAAQLLSGLQAWPPAGSVISLTHAVIDTHPDVMARLTEIYHEDDIAFRPRSRDTIARLLGPWPLLKPGLVPTSQWHSPNPHAALDPSLTTSCAAVAIHPSPAPRLPDDPAHPV
ncbi:hypothetical protein SCANM63S_04826 [Streptomyces canarius]